MEKKCVRIFKLSYCGYCRRALQYVDELQKDNPEFRVLDIETIDEREQAEEARKHDYYYVPTFYIGDEKVHEGAVTREQVAEILRRACAMDTAGSTGRVDMTAGEVEEDLPEDDNSR